MNLRADQVAHRSGKGVRGITRRSQRHRPFVGREGTIRQRVRRFRRHLFLRQVASAPSGRIGDESCGLITMLGAIGHVSRNTGLVGPVAELAALSCLRSWTKLRTIWDVLGGALAAPAPQATSGEGVGQVSPPATARA